jgi:nucleotide-binding universal stress UspA family protein
MKEILIALDYDLAAQKVAETGYVIAKALNARITLLHVVADPAYYYSNEYSPILGFTGFSALNFQTKIEEIRETGGEFLEKVKEHLKDDTIDILVKEGNASEKILEAAKEIHADLIIMASHGRKGLEKILVGSVSESVLHHTTFPILIIPTKEKEVPAVKTKDPY